VRKAICFESIDFWRGKEKGEKKKYRRSLPLSISSFPLPDPGGRRPRVNVARFSLIESKLQEGRTGPTLGGIFEQSHSK